MPDRTSAATNAYPHETRGGAPATRDDALRFNGRWTDHDRDVVAAELDRLRDRTAYFWRTGSNAYIRATDADGKGLVYVEAGYLWWRNGRVETIPEGAVREDEGWLLALSTRQESGPRRRPRDDEDPAVCQRCFSYALSVTGVCPSCDE